MEEPKFRHELKYHINTSDWMQLRSRLKHLAAPDENAGPNGSYKIRSLYFDNYSDKAIVEKLAGVKRREKFRLRYYGEDTGFIRLEKKMKNGLLAKKLQQEISGQSCEALLQGKMQKPDDKTCLLAELCIKMQTQQLRPAAIVDYEREAYIYPPGNVRITIDSNIRTSSHTGGFLNPESVTVPAANAIVLEVKFDEFLPDIMRGAVQLGGRGQTEFSKYVVSRLAT